MKIFLLVASIVFFTAVNASADMTVKDYLAMKTDEKKTLYIDFYVQGIGEGTAWSNTLLEEKKQPAMYCQPRDLALGYKEYKDIIDRQIDAMKASGKYKDDWPIGLLLLIGLQKTYPCGK